MIAETRMMATNCEAKDYETFTVLEFTDAIGCVVELHLPARMSACATMIAGAFNAHMLDRPDVVDAQTAPSEPHRQVKRVDPHAMTAVGERIAATQAAADRRTTRTPFPTGSASDTKAAEDLAAKIAVEGEGHHE